MLTHLPPHLAAQPLSLVTSERFREWRDALIKGGMLPQTVNRTMNHPSPLDRHCAN